ncbi:uncharacterized protein LOC111465143 isoform X1 [Cucurbita maxima]|uniref:Uncharacterized protein LOC111465143 isoform X1 n=1 Tax=Cucurbita maxima TaxID=3661 RepID=A0A6J1HQE8_CUCMA|nr:uncharacterized protein LOC111465143 isoform X1 [Cucurbita maxima]
MCSTFSRRRGKRMETATMETTEKAAEGLNCEAMDCLSERLSLPGRIFTATNPSQRKAILLDLLSRDVAVFLGLSITLDFCNFCSYSDHETGKKRDDASANKLMMIHDEMMNAIKRLG